MILIDTHIWIWRANNDPELRPEYRSALDTSPEGVALSAISCWEVAKKVQKGGRKQPDARTLILNMPVPRWIKAAVNLPGLAIVPLSPEIAFESTNLPGDYDQINSDPADQIIIATSRVEKIPLISVDQKIVPYPHVDPWAPPAASS